LLGDLALLVIEPVWRTLLLGQINLVLLTLVVVGLNTLRAAVRNPVKSLRTE